MRKRWLLAALVFAVSGAVYAQGPGGTPDPRLLQFRQEYEKFQKAHESTVLLTRQISALAEMTKGKKCPLTPDQAKKVLAVVNPLKKQPKLTQDQAKAAIKAIKPALTTKQLTEAGVLVKAMAERRRGGPGGGGGARAGAGAPGGRSGGRSGPGGARGSFTPPDLSKMKNYNPFLKPKADDRMGTRRYERLQEALTVLENKAKQKK